MSAVMSVRETTRGLSAYGRACLSATWTPKHIVLHPLETTESRIDLGLESKFRVMVVADVRLELMPKRFDLVEVGGVGR